MRRETRKRERLKKKLSLIVGNYKNRVFALPTLDGLKY